MFENHFILCGVGQTGVEIAMEFAKTGMQLVIIDNDSQHLDLIESAGHDNLGVLEGDATSDEVLAQVGIRKAVGLIANLPTDPENLFLTITAKWLNPEIRIVASAVEPHNRVKLMRAGADSVVYPWQIGAMRLASEMIRPTVVSFLDRMLRDPSRDTRVSEIEVDEQSGLAGKSIKSSRIHEKTGLLVVAAHQAGKAQSEFIYNPSGEHVIEAGDILLVIGEAKQIERLSEMAGA